MNPRLTLPEETDVTEAMREQLFVLAQSIQERDRLIGVAAHELRGPLASIQGLTAMLAEGEAGELGQEAQEVIQIIHGASHAALELINNMLDLATGGIAHDRLKTLPSDPVDLVHGCVAMLAVEAKRKNTRILIEADAGGPAVFDPPRLRQVVHNLLNNALKFSPPRSTVVVVVDRQPEACTIAVRDNGPGIPETERHKLFRIFGKLSNAPTGGEKSTGIGLSVCQRIVSAHGGRIEVRNVPGGGCEFRVVLPQVRDAVAA